MLSRLALAVLLPLVVLAQDGNIGDGATSSVAAAGYSCDASACKLPDCACASTSPPGGLKPSDVPQFIVFTADDAIQSYTLDSVNQFLGQRKNPNGCQPKMTYFTSLNYTNYTLVTDWYVAGNEIADHTMNHIGSPPKNEIDGNLIALNSLAGIPLTSIKGFRAPLLSYTNETLRFLHESKFLYDSTATSSIPVTDPGTDAYWPYTLDNGLANDCLSVKGVCKGEPKLPGLWEIPMYAFFDKKGVAGPHLMDPWLDAANGETKVDNNATLDYMKATFTDHYNGNRQPIGLYTHPIHLSRTYPGVNAPASTIKMVNDFLDWATVQPNVWIVSNEQLLDWVRNPKSNADLEQVQSLKCLAPQVDPSAKICNGVPGNQEGLLSHCQFPESPFYTCYGCPVEPPSPNNPNPMQVIPDGQQARLRVPGDCDTPFWDPIGGKCICTSAECAFADISRPIGPNGVNLTGGGTGSGSAAAESSAQYIPFNGNAGYSLLPSGVWPALVMGMIGAGLGAWGVVARV